MMGNYKDLLSLLGETIRRLAVVAARRTNNDLLATATATATATTL